MRLDLGLYLSNKTIYSVPQSRETIPLKVPMELKHTLTLMHIKNTGTPVAKCKI
jgi:hypothetical protein